jgi:hypothetical protein
VRRIRSQGGLELTDRAHPEVVSKIRVLRLKSNQFPVTVRGRRESPSACCLPAVEPKQPLITNARLVVRNRRKNKP